MLYHLGTDHAGINLTQLDWCCRSLFYRTSEAHLTGHLLLRTNLEAHQMYLPSVTSQITEFTKRNYKLQKLWADRRLSPAPAGAAFTHPGGPKLSPPRGTGSPCTHRNHPARCGSGEHLLRSASESFLGGYAQTPSKSLFCSSQRWGFSLPIHVNVSCSSEVFCCWRMSQQLRRAAWQPALQGAPLGAMEQGPDSEDGRL